MDVRIGTSGYSYQEWKGRFYPERLPGAAMLAFYARRFPTVEINNTFYRMPNAALVGRWGREVPEGFAFVLKAPQRITHQKRLGDVAEEVAYFLETARGLGPKLGAVLYQLPPYLKRDMGRLRAFLERLPASPPAAFEFRNESWFDDEVLEALRGKDAALCLSDTGEPDQPGPSEPATTASWGYLRLRRPEYTEADLDAWAERIRMRAWTRAFVFFKHEDEARGPELAGRLMSRFAPAAT